jgi:hypothetical protein
VFYDNYLLIKTKLNNNGANMPKPIQFKKLLFLTLLFSSSTNVFSVQTTLDYIDNQWEDDRYIDHENGTVTDTNTALMWKQCPEGLSGSNCLKNVAGDAAGTATEYTYKTAIEQAKGYEFAGHTDWRLPNIKELDSLVAYDRRDPAINSTLFPNTLYGFWSSSPYIKRARSSWSLNFSDGNDEIDNRDNKQKNYVRLVRGGE